MKKVRRGWGDGRSRQTNQGRSQVLIYSSARPSSASADDARVRACMMLGLDLARSTCPWLFWRFGWTIRRPVSFSAAQAPPTPPTKGPRDEKRETKAQLPGWDPAWGHVYRSASSSWPVGWRGTRAKNKQEHGAPFRILQVPKKWATHTIRNWQRPLATAGPSPRASTKAEREIRLGALGCYSNQRQWPSSSYLVLLGRCQLPIPFLPCEEE
jgi:hypothetical protein